MAMLFTIIDAARLLCHLLTLPGTHSLSQLPVSSSNSAWNPQSITVDKKSKYILSQHVCSSIKPDITQDLIESMTFYQKYKRDAQQSFKIPPFVSIFLNAKKTPIVTLRTGRKPFRMEVCNRMFTKYWDIFLEVHQLEAGETLVFIPESPNNFNVQIYKRNGVEKIFPWYHKYYINSHF